MERLERRWSAQIADVEFAVEDVPPEEGPGAGGEPVPLGRVVPGAGTRPPRVVVHRRPVESRALDLRELGSLVHDVVVEQVAELLGLEPEVVDPDYGEGGDDG